MREILFRGKRLDTGEWVYWTGLGRFTVTQCGRLISGKEGLTDWAYELLTVPATVGQYTGLTDMQDVKIFEGDIVQFGGEYGKIEYSETEAMFHVVFDGWLTDFDHLRGTEVEVIGNIHDNQKLLEWEAGAHE